MSTPVKQTKYSAFGKNVTLAILNTKKDLFHRNGPRRVNRVSERTLISA